MQHSYFTYVAMSLNS